MSNIYTLSDEYFKLKKQYLDDYKYFKELILLHSKGDNIELDDWFRNYLIDNCKESIAKLKETELIFENHIKQHTLLKIEELEKIKAGKDTANKDIEYIKNNNLN